MIVNDDSQDESSNSTDTYMNYLKVTAELLCLFLNVISFLNSAQVILHDSYTLSKIVLMIAIFYGAVFLPLSNKWTAYKKYMSDQANIEHLSVFNRETFGVLYRNKLQQQTDVLNVEQLEQAINRAYEEKENELYLVVYLLCIVIINLIFDFLYLI